jgi:hypothetical protein
VSHPESFEQPSNNQTSVNNPSFNSNHKISGIKSGGKVTITQTIGNNGGSQKCGNVYGKMGATVIQQGGSNNSCGNVSSDDSWISDVRYIEGLPHFSFRGPLMFNEFIHSDGRTITFYNEEYKCEPNDLCRVEGKKITIVNI